MAFLIFSLDCGEPVELQITGPILIGSSPEAGIIIEGFEVAAHHAEVYPDERGNCWARDLGSSAGIYVNGRRTVFQELHKGDELRCGEFIFQFFDFLEEKKQHSHGILLKAHAGSAPDISSGTIDVPKAIFEESPVTKTSASDTQKLDYAPVTSASKAIAAVPSKITERIIIKNDHRESAPHSPAAAGPDPIPAITSSQPSKRSWFDSFALVLFANAVLFTAGFVWLYYKTKYDLEIKLSQFAMWSPTKMTDPNEGTNELKKQIASLGKTEAEVLKKLDVSEEKFVIIDRQFVDLERRDNERKSAELIKEQEREREQEKGAAKEKDKAATPPVSVAIPSPTPDVADSLPLEKSEMILLKERNRLTGLADEAIATGARASYERLWDTFDDPRLGNLIHAARAEILRVQDCFITGQRARFYGLQQHKIPVAEIFPDTPASTQDQLSEEQLVKVLQNQQLAWQNRVKAAFYLGRHRSAKSGEALVEAIKKDPMLDVVAEATFSFEQVTGYHAKLFDTASLGDWWKAYSEKSSIPNAVPAPGTEEQAGIKGGSKSGSQ